MESLLGDECILKVRDFDEIEVYPSSVQYRKVK